MSLAGKHSTGHGASARQGRSKPAIWREFFTGLAFTFVLLGLKSYVAARTAFGEQTELMGYNLIQTLLSSGFTNQDIPIQILDISNLPVTPVGSGSDLATPRERLLNLIEAVAEQQPKAIGVDIDFSPDEHGYKDPARDPAFFRSILGLRQKTGVPIFLGIWRTADLPPQWWLGSPEFSPLAACILVPRHDSRRMVTRILNEHGPPGPTLCSVLAAAFPKPARQESRWAAWLLRPTSVAKVSEDVSFEEFPVDYSPRTALEHDRLTTINPVSVRDEAQRFKDKIVLLGDGTLEEADKGDIFPIPGRPWEQCPGVYVHACAVYSLINDPLYELTPAGRVFVDLLLSILVLGSVLSVRLYYRTKGDRAVAAHRLQRGVTAVVAILAIIIGYRMVLRHRGYLGRFPAGCDRTAD